MGCCLGDELLTLMRCHSFMKPWKGGNQSVDKPTTYEHKGEILCFSSLSQAFSFAVAHFLA